MIKAPDYLMYCVDPSKKLLYSKWLQAVSSAQYREGMSFLCEVLQSQNLSLWLNNNSYLNQLSVEDQKWVTEEFGLLLVGSTLKHMASIVTAREESGLVIKAIRDKSYRIFGKGVIVEFFEDEETALAWLLPNMQHYRLPKSTDNSTECVPV